MHKKSARVECATWNNLVQKQMTCLSAGITNDSTGNIKAIKLKLSTDGEKKSRQKNHWLIFLQKQRGDQLTTAFPVLLSGADWNSPLCSFLPLLSSLGALLASGCGLGALAQLKPRVASVLEMLSLVIRKETIVKIKKT